MRQIANRPKIRIQLKFLAQRDVDAGEAAAYWRGHRPFQPYASPLDRLQHIFRNVLTILLERIRTHLERFPLKLHTCRFQNANCGPRYFRPDAVAGYQRDFMTHTYFLKRTLKIRDAASAICTLATLSAASHEFPRLP